MARIHLVRHGKAAAGWGSDADPGLDALGRSQAEAVARAFADGPVMPVLTSPLRRCRETAMPLARAWSMVPQVETAVSEIPSPTDDLAARAGWLRRVMPGTWPDLARDPDSAAVDFPGWRSQLLECLARLPADTVVFTHFIAINAAVGAATGDDRIVCFRPDNGSVTVLETAPGGGLEVVSLGREAETEVR